jgi:hypothetical protein
MALTPINLAHAMTASWVVALHRLIYGGDPGPEEITMTKQEVATMAAAIINELKPLAEDASPSASLPNISAEEVQRRLGLYGFEFHTHDEGKRVALTPDFGHVPPRICPCFGPKPHTKCICVSLS